MLNFLSKIVVIPAVLALVACSSGQQETMKDRMAIIDYGLLVNLPDEPISFSEEIQPILDKRCVVCHGCFDAPCQLKLSSHAGITRGVNPQKVYDGARVRAARPTRLHIDAQTDVEWRTMNFSPVLNEGEPGGANNLRNSVLYQMLRLKQLNPQPRTGLLPSSFDLGLDRDQTCAKSDKFEKFAEEHPLWGMPYAMPNLEEDDYDTLVQWIAQGAPASPAPEASPEAMRQIAQWERFLNGASNKERLMSRYVYEHLFLGHLHFAGTGDREFYRLIRSSTLPGQPAEEIPTVRPFDDPGTGGLYYRIVPYRSTIVAKSHLVYPMSDARLRRYRQLFLDPEYRVESLPGYDPETASNPFITFAAMPADSRYRFLLDEARYFIDGFIKGPVCRGQVALNVIEDQFWVTFFNPDSAVGVNERSGFLDSMAAELRFPAARGNTLNLAATWTDYRKRQRKYLEAKATMLEELSTGSLDDAMDAIWDGDGKNRNAALTVFRHFDSATVTYGFVGDYPQTAWIIDYPLFERIHYLLVAGFDVFGNVGHQLNTRLYMDFLRMEGEDDFLLFLPPETRQALRNEWYQGNRSRRKDKLFVATDAWRAADLVAGYQTDDPQRELYKAMERRLGDMAGPLDYLNRCPDETCASTAETETERAVDAAMQRIARLTGKDLNIIPDADVMFVRVKNIDGAGRDAAYSIVINKGYSNVTSIFADESERDPSDDTLTVYKGFIGVYPNFFVSLEADRINEFVSRYLAIKTLADYEQVVTRFGVRRTNSRFWSESDWFHEEYARLEPLEAGIFDLNRYQNR